MDMEKGILGQIRVSELIAMAALVAVLAALAWWQRRRDTAVFTILSLGGLALVYGGILVSVARDHRWRWDLSALPALIILNHAFYLFLLRRRAIPLNTGSALEAMKNNPNRERLVPALDQLQNDAERYFSLESLLLRYGVPAIFVGGLCVGLSNFLFDSDAIKTSRLPPAAILGAQYGLAGAYVYSLLYLGKRAFRQDITPGAANWVAVTIGVGPVLAGALGTFLRVESQATIPVTAQAVLFVAGLAPRAVVEFIESQVRRNYFGQTGGLASQRVLPLSEVRGLGLEVQERLAEEGIDNASSLAMADPLRLLRNTSYDKRQIVSWIDSALLYVSLPDQVRALEALGITGAIDLAWCIPSESAKLDAASVDRLASLAAEIKMDPGILTSVAERLREDGQLTQIWVLYQAAREDLPVEPAPQPA